MRYRWRGPCVVIQIIIFSIGNHHSSTEDPHFSDQIPVCGTPRGVKRCEMQETPLNHHCVIIVVVSSCFHHFIIILSPFCNQIMQVMGCVLKHDGSILISLPMSSEYCSHQCWASDLSIASPIQDMYVQHNYATCILSEPPLGSASGGDLDASDLRRSITVD